MTVLTLIVFRGGAYIDHQLGFTVVTQLIHSFSAVIARVTGNSGIDVEIRFIVTLIILLDQCEKRERLIVRIRVLIGQRISLILFIYLFF